MKCVMEKESKKVKRLKDKEARELVKSGKHEYCAKRFWKPKKD